MSATLVGRDELVRELVEGLDGVSPAPVAVLTGPAGIGRSAVLSAVAAEAAARGLVVLRFAMARRRAGAPFHLAGLLASAVSRLPARTQPMAPSGGGADADEVEQVAAELTRLMLARPGLVVLLDDAQWLDPSSLAVLELLVRRLSRVTVRWVCAVRSPARPQPHAELDRLLVERLVRLVPLRPLSRVDSDALLGDLIQARPHPLLSERVRRLSRGIPAAVHAAVDGYLRAGSLLVTGGHGYLLHPSRPLRLPPEHPCRAMLRDLPWPPRAVAMGMAVLHPFGEAAPRLVAEALGIPAEEIAAALDVLLTEGVLRVDPRGGWRFTVPLLAEVCDDELRPWARRRLAQAAVDALWAGVAHAPDDRYLAEQLLRCGRHGAPGQAHAELVRLGLTALRRDARSAARWLAAATELAVDPGARWSALAAHATAACLLGDFATAVHSTRRLLRVPTDDLPQDTALESCLMHVMALWGSGDTAAVRRVAFGEERLGTHPAHGTLARCIALCLLGRWDDAHRYLEQARRAWTGVQDSDGFADFVQAAAGALTGRPERFRTLLASGPAARWLRSHPIVVRVATRLLLTIGDTAAAERLLRDVGLRIDQLAAPDRAVLAWERGSWDDALHHARSGAEWMSSGQPGPSVVRHVTAAIMLSRGQPAAGRAVLAADRDEPGTMAHLLDITASAIARTYGDARAAREHVRHGLAYAHRHGIVPGTEELWLHATELALDAGDRDGARHAARNAAGVAEVQQTDRGRLVALLAELAVAPHAALAREALALARRLEQPRMLAHALRAVAEAGHGEPALLGEAYELYGEMDALLDRYRLRQLMRRHNVVVSNRAATTAETDRLLAVLVADGASNRELAAVLRTSTKSVEGMLTRLFARTGFRSRVDLATAVLAGGYPTDRAPTKYRENPRPQDIREAGAVATFGRKPLLTRRDEESR